MGIAVFAAVAGLVLLATIPTAAVVAKGHDELLAVILLAVVALLALWGGLAPGGQR